MCTRHLYERLLGYASRQALTGGTKEMIQCFLDYIEHCRVKMFETM